MAIEPTVVTIDPDRWLPRRFALDQTYAPSVAEINTIKVSDRGWRYHLQESKPSLHKYAWFLAYPGLLDYASAWSARIRRRSRLIVAEVQPNVVYVSAPPFSSIRAAQHLARSAGAPLIIDFRDPWTTASLAAHPSLYHFAWEQRAERKALLEARQIILNTDEAMELVSRWIPAIAARCVVIPNGAVQSGPKLRRNTGDGQAGPARFRLVFTGTLYEDRVVVSTRGQYRPRPLDEGARSLRPLLAALTVLKHRSPDDFSRLDIVVAGSVPRQQVEAVTTAGFSDTFTFVGTVSHAESLKLIHGADALYLNQVAWQDHTEVMPHVPGKVFEYLQTGRPVVAALGAGATRRVLEGDPTARISHLGAPNSLARQLLKAMSGEEPAELDRAIQADDGQQRFAELVKRLACEEHPSDERT